MADRAYRNGVQMQRRHFCFIAEVIAKELEGEVRRQAAKTFADCLRSTNSQFKRDRFLDACSVSEEQ